MSNRHLAQAFQRFSREAQRLYRNLNRNLVNWMLRSAFITQQRGRGPVSGFVLPTVILLLLVITLTVGAIVLRAVDRNTQVIANTQQKVIYNAATPAIDRARAKIEFLFDPSRDTRYPGGVPRESTYILPGMLNNGTGGLNKLPAPETGYPNDDVYTLPGETRLNIGGQDLGTIKAADNDNAWYYKTDTDGDGKTDATVVYSILFQTPSDKTTAASGTTPEVKVVGSERLLSLTDAQKAKDLLVRNAPISNDAKLSGCSAGGENGGAIQDGWFPDKSSSSKIRKNFQVDAIVIPDNPKAAAVTLEFQQDRQLDKGNKWGAWFRYDLEIFPGPTFNWNGAMHTEGNLIPGGGSFTAYLVSAPKSCLYQRDSSEISITRLKPDDEKDQKDLTKDAKADGKTFVGQLIMAKIASGAEDGTATFHHHTQADETALPGTVTVGRGNDSTRDGFDSKDVMSDPVAILLGEQYQSRGASRSNKASDEWKPKIEDTNTGLRIKSNREKLPYVDDLYRADDRWGPKPKYDNEEDGRIPDGQNVGAAIPVASRLLNAGTPGDSSASVGLDGYWERRARIDGLRVLVGERLELGDIGTWETPRDVNDDSYITPPDKDGLPTMVTSASSSYVTNAATGAVEAKTIAAEEKAGDPLYPPTVQPYPVAKGKILDHRMQARRTLRDNLPAVQSAAIYHAGVTAPRKDSLGRDDVDYPVACFAMTSHPGNVHTLRNSVSFIPTFFAGDNLLSNFFTGQGTNGWEFEPPAGANDKFVLAMNNKNSSLRIALQNLANFAGDPDGAFPPKQETTKNIIHPYPALTMWGNYSNLRRALARLDDSTVGYDRLSVADKTYLQTAACTLGMLAYNVDKIQAFDITNKDNDGLFGDSSTSFLMTKLAETLFLMMDGNVDKGGEVLPKAKLATYSYDPNGTYDKAKYSPADYYEVPPEAYISALKQKVAIDGGDPLTDPKVRLAELIMLKHQVRRDRTFGFRSSQAFGDYVIDSVDGTQVSQVYAKDPLATPPAPAGTTTTALVFPTACDPDLFVLRDNRSPSLGYPRQSRSSIDAAGNLKPIPTTLNAILVNDPNAPGAVVSNIGGSEELSRYRLALSRLCGTIDASNYRDDTGNPLSKAGLASSTADPFKASAIDPRKKATVKPMFPSLYYLFPEEEHGLKGALKPGAAAGDAEIADEADAYDHRQPGTFAATPTEAERIAAKAGLHPKDKESYVVDSYVSQVAQEKAVTFKPVDQTPPTQPNLTTKPYFHKDNTTRNLASLSLVGNGNLTDANTNLARRPYLGSVYPVPDLPVSSLAIKPRLVADWQLPIIDPVASTDNTSPNTILVPNGDLTPNMKRDNGLRKAVPFLDRAIYDGRQDMMARLTDIDLGMLRQAKPKTLDGFTSFQNKTDKVGPNEMWLPISGIVYAFREDGVREDAIARKATKLEPKIENLTPGTTMNATNLAAPVDPEVIGTQYPGIIADAHGISLKPIDFLSDPDRRIHGFRLRNATRIDREGNLGKLTATDNVRGLSFFTDNPVYLQGNFNLHQDAAGAALEEFTSKILETGYDYNSFYKGRTVRDDKFAKPELDRWRPSEILADAIDILSTDFCDGSIADGFTPNTLPTGSTAPTGTTRYIAGFPDYDTSKTNGADITRTRYQDPTAALYGGSGCTGNGKTSFQNQAGPTDTPPNTSTSSWDWMRENAAMTTPQNVKQVWQDFTTPIRISRTGDALIVNRPSKASVTTAITPPTGGAVSLPDNKLRGDFRPVRYELDRGLRYVGRNAGGFTRMVASPTKINSIVVSGIQPSRPNQAYGGLHNFPRFLENWDSTKLFYSGSFIQLNFSNYATSNYEKEGMEPVEVTDSGGTVPTGAATSENIPYYRPPDRVWGYDVALQFAPAGPAAARFVTPSSTRSEFYTEPPRTDPYIKQLCVAGKTVAPASAQLNCPG